jgi:uncharacterized damage-inducible protein DinB
MMNVYQLLEYDAWAAAKLLEAVEALSPEQFVREFAGSLSSVRQQFVHLVSVTDRYRARLAQDTVPDVSPDSIATPQALVAYEAQVRERLQDFMNCLEDDDLRKVREHHTRRGSFWLPRSKRFSTWLTMLHTIVGRLSVYSRCTTWTLPTRMSLFGSTKDRPEHHQPQHRTSPASQAWAS